MEIFFSLSVNIDKNIRTNSLHEKWGISLQLMCPTHPIKCSNFFLSLSCARRKTYGEKLVDILEGVMQQLLQKLSRAVKGPSHKIRLRNIYRFVSLTINVDKIELKPRYN